MENEVDKENTKIKEEISQIVRDLNDKIYNMVILNKSKTYKCDHKHYDTFSCGSSVWTECIICGQIL